MLVLPEAHFSRSKRFDQETMLAVEDARENKAAEPAKLPAGLRRKHGGANRHSRSAAGLYAGFETGPFFRNAADETQKGVPLLIGLLPLDDRPDWRIPRQ